MSHGTSLQPVPDPTRADLAALELRVAERERELTAIKIELQDLQTRYLSEIGSLYAELNTFEEAIAAEETRLGIRPPALLDEENDEADSADAANATGAGCTNRSAASVNLKKMFRDVARAVHPDRAVDDRARYRRHSLMAEANRAYAEQDEDRLRLILRTAEIADDADVAEDSDSRHRRRAARLGDRLLQIDAELSDLRASAIARLKGRIDETKAQGWDLFGEMLRHVKREIVRATARLAKLRRTATASGRS